MDVGSVGVIVLVIQLVTGGATAWVARRAVNKKVDTLAEIATKGGTTVKFDKSDILAIAFAVFIFWGAGTRLLDSGQALGAFVAVVSGTGVKELIQALVPAHGAT